MVKSPLLRLLDHLLWVNLILLQHFWGDKKKSINRFKKNTSVWKTYAEFYVEEVWGGMRQRAHLVTLSINLPEGGTLVSWHTPKVKSSTYCTSFQVEEKTKILPAGPPFSFSTAMKLFLVSTLKTHFQVSVLLVLCQVLQHLLPGDISYGIFRWGSCYWLELWLPFKTFGLVDLILKTQHKSSSHQCSISSYLFSFEHSD